MLRLKYDNTYHSTIKVKPDDAKSLMLMLLTLFSKIMIKILNL